MDALTALWFTSVVGAVGFTATGFFLARSGLVGGGDLALAKKETEHDVARARASKPPAAGAAPAEVTPAEVTSHGADMTPAPDVETPGSRVPTLPPPPPVLTTSLAETLPPPAPTLPPPALTLPPPAGTPTPATGNPAYTASRRPLPREEEGDGSYPVDAMDVRRALSKSSHAPPSVSQANRELERQLQALRLELRAEVVARDKVEAHAKDLAERLSTISQRHTETVMRSSLIPPASSDARTRLSSRAPGLFAEIDALKSEVARLTAENASLRAAAIGAPIPGPRSTQARTDLIVPEVLRRMVERIAALDHVRAAVVAERSGLTLAGSGPLADALAAFGAYLEDAAARSERLLPLKATRLVMVRDTHGLVFTTQVLGRPEAELSLVTLTQDDGPAEQIRDIVAQTPGLTADTHSAR